MASVNLGLSDGIPMVLPQNGSFIVIGSQTYQPPKTLAIKKKKIPKMYSHYQKQVMIEQSSKGVL